jgi:acetolactate synthase I/III small subunit
MSLHTVSVLVQDKPGVLARVAGLFARRGFNIHSLAVGNTEDDGTSRMTIVVEIKTKPLEQVTKQLNKLVNVLKVAELEHGSAVERELALIKVKATNGDRPRVIEVAQIFRARILDVAHEALTIEITGSSDKVEAFHELLRPFGVIEMVRTGRVALSRGDEGLKERRLRAVRAETA